MAAGENILQKIAARTRERVAAEKRAVSLDEMARRARSKAARELAASKTGEFEFSFERALKARGMSFICEVKRASPSKGLISEDFDPVSIAREYEAAGAAAISCLTEPFWFQGSDGYLAAIADAVDIPVLRKDFIVDEYMVYQAKEIGASAVLLICAILSDEELERFVALAHELGLSALVEAYEPGEVPRALAAGARIVGVNNRDLRTFEVDFGRSIDLRPTVGAERVFVSESGVSSREDVAALEAADVDAVLIGETLMRAADKRAMLDGLRGHVGCDALAGAPRRGSKGEGATHVRVKLCGLSRDEDIDAVIAAAPDMCGFVVDFPKSHRSVSLARAKELGLRLAGSGIERVGVFVDEDIENIVSLVNAGALDAVQLHGGEDAAYIGRLREAIGCDVRIIQAFRVDDERDLAVAALSSADIVLLDSGQGSGRTFDWSLLAPDAPHRPNRPFILAGGLAPENVADAIRLVHPWGVDMSSGIETSAVKDPEKMKRAVACVRAAEQEGNQ